jgi:hypothetical protein
LAASKNGPSAIVRIVGAERYIFAFFVFRAQHVELHTDPPVSIAAQNDPVSEPARIHDLINYWGGADRWTRKSTAFKTVLSIYYIK